MAKQKIETSIEINGVDVVAYPFVESDHITFENGMSINEMIKEDVSTPIINHEETSFKVGKGDSDVSSSIVDSSVGEMSIKGQTYQNILPEPSLRNSMSKGKTMQKFNEGCDNINVVDGVGKSAILKGQTLVNLKPNKQLNGWGKHSYDASSGICILNGLNAGIKFDISLLKTSTKYLVVLEIIELPTFVVENDNPIKLTLGNSNYNYVNIHKNEFKIGVLKKVMTTPDNFIETIAIGNRGELSTPIKLRFMILEYQEGMENWDIPYFEGMKSVESPILTSVGKNLFDPTMKKNYTYPFKLKGGTTLTLSTKDSVMSDGGNIRFKDKDDKDVWLGIDKGTTKKTITLNRDVYKITNMLEGDIEYQLEISPTPTPYEPYKSNILTTPSDLTLRGIGDVCDTLDLVSGEKVEHIGEILLDGNQNIFNDGSLLFYPIPFRVRNDMCVSDKLPSVTVSQIVQGVTGIGTQDRGHEGRLYINIDGIATKEEMKNFFKSNPVRIQCVLVEPTITQIPLSSSGNWEKVVLDGSEDEKWLIGTAANGVGKYFILNGVCTPNLPLTTNTNAFCDKFPYVRFSALDDKGFGFNSSYGLRFHIEEVNIYKGATVEDFRQYLSQNPITVWHQTTSHQNSTQVKQPLSFSNGHIQLSSKDGSLIPSLDYEVPTSNSYHLDLAKTSTQYTMKNMSGTFTIDGNSYNASADGTFTTPNSMTNKLMITSVVQSNAMLLEGNLTSKTIPYFKGIKSAFEGEDKIEVLSTGKNLFKNKDVINTGKGVTITFDNSEMLFSGTYTSANLWSEKPLSNPIKLKSGNYNYSIQGVENETVYFKTSTGEKKYAGNWTFDTDVELVRVHIGLTQNKKYDDIVFKIQIEESSTPTPYEPYKSNITKIPLLSPLRSLPNGVRDEVILDRDNNKVKVIQRVGMFKFDSKDKYGCSIYVEKGWDTNNSTGFIYRKYTPKGIDGVENKNGYHMCDNLDVSTRNTINSKTNVCVLGNGQYIGLKISNDKVGHNGNRANDYLSKNPTTVYYQLETPIITEIDLDGYPYIHKDGHIFLNSEIAPTTTMKYSINQSHQIESQNGDLIRHEKEINYLYTLIAKYVNVQYESTLLNLDLELSRA